MASPAWVNRCLGCSKLYIDLNLSDCIMCESSLALERNATVRTKSSATSGNPSEPRNNIAVRSVTPAELEQALSYLSAEIRSSANNPDRKYREYDASSNPQGRSTDHGAAARKGDFYQPGDGKKENSRHRSRNPAKTVEQTRAEINPEDQGSQEDTTKPTQAVEHARSSSPKNDGPGILPDVWCPLHHCAGHHIGVHCWQLPRTSTIKPMNFHWRNPPAGWLQQLLNSNFPILGTIGDLLDQLQYANQLVEGYQETVAKRDGMLLDIGLHMQPTFTSHFVTELWQELMSVTCCTVDRYMRRLNGAFAHARRAIVLNAVSKRMDADPKHRKPWNVKEGYSAAEIMAWFNEDHKRRCPPLDKTAYDRFIGMMRDTADELGGELNRLSDATIQAATSSYEVMRSTFLRAAFEMPVMWMLRLADLSVRHSRGMHIFQWPNVTILYNQMEGLLTECGS